MKRIIKNVLMIAIIIIVGVSMFFTMKDAKNNLLNFEKTDIQRGDVFSRPEGEEGEIPEMPTDSDGEISEKLERNDIDDESTPPEKPSGDNENEDMELPEGDFGNMPENGQMQNRGNFEVMKWKLS